MQNKKQANPSKSGGAGNPVGSVMVVGGGVAGIQAALDMAESGYYVYLVEKSSAIGGVMSQLDKTFPTNDCSMCIISPKLVEAGRHRNIELLTMAELVGLDGEAGSLTARVHQRPRFINLDKCTGCGDCSKVCPIDLANEFDEGLSGKKAAYKRYPQAVPGAFAIEKKGVAPCKATCPAHISVQGYVALVAKGEYQEALKLIKEENPLPAICGRVCHHPCEDECTRRDLDEAVAIDFIKRFVADLDLDSDTRFIPEIKEKKDEWVAVIGSGPSGLSCAYYLAREGYKVTIYEKLPVEGGMLSVGIPEYRLPRDIIQAEIQVIKDMGVEIKTNMELGKDITVEQLRADGAKAIFLGIGAHECKTLGLEGEDLEGVVPGVDYLREVNLGKKIDLGKRVAVVGGGNVAMDCVRTAIRTGSEKAFVLYRRSEEEMPANPEEIEECHEEGIEIHTLVNPVRIIGENGKVKAVECIRMELGEPDESGRRRPVPVEGSEFTIEIDAIMPAIGQATDWACLTPECGCTLSDWGTMQVDPITLQTQDPDIFAGGDAVTGPATVIQAIAAGKQAAISIDRLVKGEDLKEGREKDWSPVKPEDIERYDEIPRAKMPRLEPDERIKSFDEVMLGFSEDQAVAEAKRCLACGICSECYRCVEACLAHAVEHDQEPVEREIEVGGVILSPGADTFDPSITDLYLYGKHPNVVTSLEFERILSASGPYMGHMQRPSDGQEPGKVAWIQCVGSRNINDCDNAYCSGVCCMYAIKEAVVAKEHSHNPDDFEATIFFMDMRTYGKDFEKYYNRAKDEYGVNFVRSRVHTIFPVPETDQLRIDYVTEDGEIRSDVFDMVVLSVGLQTASGTMELADTLGIELNQHRFAKTDPFAPVSTSRSGVYTCGVFQGPKDIPGSVMEASAAAAGCAQELAEARGTLAVEKELPPEQDVTEEEPRIGVFICNCGINIGSVVDVPEVVEYAKTLPHVVLTDENLFTCSQDTQERMREVIMEHNLNRLVVAACSPRTHEPLFRETLLACGLNKYLFEMANIRDQDSWVHQVEPAEATRKAKDLVRMAVARAALLRPLKEEPLEIVQTGLVIGGGVAGMNAALSLARQGFDTVLVEKEKDLGGLASRVSHTIEGADVKSYLDRLTREVTSHDRIKVITGAEVVGFGGYRGNFTTDIKVGGNGERETISHGATILATGAKEYVPEEFLYGEDDRVMTQLELGEKIAAAKDEVAGWNSVVMIQCVGSRNEENPNCSRICCQGAIKHALELKELNPDMQVTILYRDIRMYGFLEDYYQEAREKGIRFARFDLENQPDVSVNGGGLEVNFKDHVLDRSLAAHPDAVVLSSATIPNENKGLATLLKLPRDAEGFFIEAHAKLRPVDFSSEGLYLCGTAHAPKLITESIAQALAAAARAGSFLASEYLTVGGPIAIVDPDKCAVCLTCVRTCPYEVPKIGADGYAIIDAASCQGCGACVAECPGKAIVLQHFTDDQLVAKSLALFAG